MTPLTQGREADVVVISTVRSGRLGFADDPRRINVALTRARHGLVLIGHAPTLGKGKCWGEWVRWAQQNNLVLPEAALLNGSENPAAASWSAPPPRAAATAAAASYGNSTGMLSP